MTRFVVVPQWQGSPSPRAMRLIDGADAIAGDLPRSRVSRVDVPAEAGEALGSGIRRLSTLTRVRDAIGDALAADDETAIVVGGDCAVAIPAIAHAATRHPSLAVVWFDAHGDLHTPATSPSGALAGMALRAVSAPNPFVDAQLVPAGRVVLAGARTFDDDEAAHVFSEEPRHVAASELDDPATLADAVVATGADAVYIHVDLDVLDPATVTGVLDPVPFGVTPAELVAAIGAVRDRMPLVGASIAGFAPSSPDVAVDDLGTILRIVGALA
ncbi:arginase family protein [Microbacterium dauci]|uniref:Arginase family protein n=1 Tax=Microbacterium dauci TaxID=3048008 RepID=A0ABT6ZAI8_9MICO|nr:arginase family protein [Microbacterium sp. LX3-4]MDJ1113011.1 arginase family protein [Microbacterium sp. LX3-4]